MAPSRYLRPGLLAVSLLCAAAPFSPSAAQTPARFLTSEQIRLYGLGLRVEPEEQTVPKDIATIVATYLQAPSNPGDLPPFAPDAEVRATLRGPSFAEPLELRASPNAPLNVPPLTVAGIHTVENIRLVSGGEVVLYGSPETVTITVIDKLLVTQITARPLTAEEIREKGIVFDKSSFQAFNFAAAFAISPGNDIRIEFPVVLPTIAGAADVNPPSFDLQTIDTPLLKDLATIVPDTLAIQAAIPNLSVTGFALRVPTLQGQNFVVPPIPGVVVIPGDIGFLNQYFSVLLMVANVAPTGSRLVVSDLTATIVLPAGNDTVVGSVDDPLRMAVTTSGGAATTVPVTQAGPDGRLGTSDDIPTLGPGETGNAEFLVEGRREGSHVIEMELTGVLNGLPVGPVPIRGRAAGAVLVRNPRFTLTFTHPEIVNAGERYALDVTVTNTGESPANFVSVNLFGRNISGATLVGPPSQSIESILPGDAQTVSFELVSNLTGRVTAATLDSDENVAGRFALKTAVGEFGVPLSPDSLVLPKEANGLPTTLRDAALGLLGRAHAVATAPAAALPREVTRFSRKVVYDRAVEVAEAGFRATLGEALPLSAWHLLLDFGGNTYARLAERNTVRELPFIESDYRGFDELRRRSVRGDVVAARVADLLAEPLARQGAGDFHASLASAASFRAAHVSVLLASTTGGPLPVSLVLRDAAGRRTGLVAADGKIVKEVPFSDLVSFGASPDAATAQLGVLASPAGDYVIELHRNGAIPASGRFSLSLVLPRQDGTFRQVIFADVGVGQVPVVSTAAGDAHGVRVELFDGGAPISGTPAAPPTLSAIADPPPSVVGVQQQADADVLTCENSVIAKAGRVIAVLLSEEVTPAEAQDKLGAGEISKYEVDGNRVVGVALQPGRRIVFLALRDPIGPFVPRSLTVSGIADRRGQPMPAPDTRPIAITVPETAGVVSGQILNATGQPAPFANVRLFYQAVCDDTLVTFGISAKPADEQGRYRFDYVWRPNISNVKLVALDPDSEQFRELRFNLARDAQQLTVDVVFLGRGAIEGRTLDERGRPLAGTVVRVTSLTDQSQFGSVTDSDGRYRFDRVPVGNVLIEAVSVTPPAQVFISENVPSPGAVVIRDITLFDVNTAPLQPKVGTIAGFVLRSDGVTPVADVPVYAFYRNRSQQGVRCPPPPGSIEEPQECAIAVTRTDTNGAFRFERIIAGELRLQTFDQAGLEQGDASLQLAPDASAAINVLLVGGLATVTGVVLDPSGAPAAGARVGGGLSIVTADGAGRFTLTDVPVGRRTIVAVSDALGTKGQTEVDVFRAGETYNATVVLSAVGSVAGIVRESNGVTPAPGIVVYLLRDCTVVDPQTGQSVKAACIDGQATTAANGAYRIDGVKVGDYRLSAFRGDFRDGNIVPVTVSFFRQVVRADITFRGQGRVTGRVVDDDGVTPLPAYVSVSGEQLVIAGGRVGSKFERVENYRIVQTGFDGSFAFNGVWAGSFTLRAAGQFSPDPIAFQGTLAAGATANVTLRLQPTSEITGTVFLPDGVTPAGANVIVRYRSEAFKVFCAEDDLGDTVCQTIPQGIQDTTVVTESNGRFRFPIVNAGAFTITADDPASGRTATLKGSVKAGESGEFAIRLLGLSDVVVRVYAANRDAQGNPVPIPGARVEVEQIEAPKRKLTRTAGTEGADTGVARFAGGDAFSEGDFVVRATDLRTGFVGRASGRVTVGDATVTVDVFLFDATGTVSGTVFEADGLTPVPNAEVVISNASGPIAFAVTGPDGSYSQAEIPLGVVRVEAFDARTASRGYGEARVDFNGQDVPVNVSLAALGVVRGTLLAAGTLEPLTNWEVRLDQAAPSGRPLPTLRTSSGIDGGFSFPGAAVGAFRVFASKVGIVGSASVDGAVSRPGQIVDVPVVVNLVTPATAVIAGVVVDVNGAVPGNAEITVDQGPFSPARNLTAAADGTFRVDGLTLGRYRVTARSQVTANTGTSYTDLNFDGQVANLVLPLVGLSSVSGVVVKADGTPPDRPVNLVLTGQPATGCGGPCAAATDASGSFSFSGLAVRTFSITATDPVTGLRGSIGDEVSPGASRTGLRIVLEPSGSLSGEVSFPDGTRAASIVAELVKGSTRLFAETDGNGRFDFPVVSIAGTRTWTLTLRDPIGPGLARRTVTIDGPTELGPIVLDTAVPSITSLTPANGATGVALDTAVRLEFSEALDLSGVTAANIRISGPSGQVAGTLETGSGDRVITFRPLAPLADQTRFTIEVENLKDPLGKTMAPFAAAFTTVDITPPATLEIAPGAGATGVTIYTPIRVKFNEPVDPLAFPGPAITLSRDGAPVEGRLDFAFGNTVVIFTPNRPLDEDRAYQVTVLAARDLAGNAQPSATSLVFTTTDRTPPQVLGLTVEGGSTVVENGVARVIATVGSTDVAFVDFFLNGAPAAVARTVPFTIAFQATPALGGPGSQIQVAAIATDTSGNRGLVPATATVTVTADQPPVVTFLSPGAAITARNGDRVTLEVRATDDLGVTAVAYRANTGDTRTAASVTVTPAATERTTTFAFDVPTTVVPGTSFTIEASASDTKGQTGTAAPITVTVVDAVPPTVEITGVSTGQRVRPGQSVTAIVAASDPGKIARVGFAATGAASFSQTRTMDVPQGAVSVAFTFVVDAGADPTDRVTLSAFAVDVAGNRADAGQVILPIADSVPPTVTVTAETGVLEMVPGQPVRLVTTAQDEIGVTRITLSGTGAFTFSDAKAISPALAEAQATFTVNVPASVQDGQTVTVTARAVDLSGNVSAPAALTLTARAVSDVTLPASALLLAGDVSATTVQVPAAAPAGGLRIDLVSANPAVASVPSFVTVPEGVASAVFDITGVAGGTTTIEARVGGVPRASMTVTVRGGVVRGRVVDETFTPVAGVRVTAIGSTTVVTDTLADGTFLVEGVTRAANQPITVRAFDEASGRLGVATGSYAVANGALTLADIVLLRAGAFTGTVVQADVAGNPAGAGVRVDLFQATGSQPGALVATTFTGADSRFAFDLVSIGSYVIEASDAAGNRGRLLAGIGSSGATVDVVVRYLGRGAVRGTVRTAAGAVVPNASLTLSANSVFGSTTRTTSAAADGTFRFDGVFVGTFSLQASDPVSGAIGGVSGAVALHQEEVTADVSLTPFSNLRGTVFRADGVTPAGGGVNVTLNRCNGSNASGCNVVTVTDELGQYRFDFLPLVANAIVVARDPATRGVGRGTIALNINGATPTLDITFQPQGTLVVLVTDANATPQPSAAVTVNATGAGVSDQLTATTGANGTVVVERVLAGTVSVSASAGGLSGSASTTLAGGEVKNVTVSLQPTATITGRVFLPNGQSPATSGRVVLTRETTPFTATTITLTPEADGVYRAEGLPLTSYVVRVFDADNQLRAIARGVTLSSNNQVETRDFVMVGLGRVQGRVVNPDGSAASGIAVVVSSLVSEFGLSRTVTADGGGNYAAERMPVGSVLVTAQTASLIGDARGQLSADGQVLTLDVLLESNAVTLPVTVNDANQSPYTILGSARLDGGFYSVFFGDGSANRGSAILQIVRNGTTEAFAGSAFGTYENQRREIAIRQDALQGLSVVRKVFVPATGYFTRHLELLTNPTAQDITVDVRVVSNYRAAQCCSVNLVTTSSGDRAVTPADRWVVLDDFTDGDPQYVFNTPPVAYVLSGTGAAAAPQAVTYQDFGNRVAQLAATWQQVTVPAGQTVALMHFVSQQVHRAGASAAAQRLEKLPPEALEGLSATEIVAIRNFVVPADGVGTVEPLPALTGTVNGTVFEGDGSTTVQDATLSLVSSSPYFGRRVEFASATGGVFSVTGLAGGALPIPIAPFTITATHPGSGNAGPATPGAFAEGATAATVNVLFTNLGWIEGTVRRANGLVAPDVRVVMQTTTGSYIGERTTNVNGFFRFAGVTPGTVVLTGEQNNPQGTGIKTPPTQVQVTAGQRVTPELTLEPAGSLRITVVNASGVAVPDAYVEWERDNYAFYRSARTTATGTVESFFMPVGTFNLTVYDPNGNVPTRTTFSIAFGQQTVVNVQLVRLGTVTVTVLRTNGQPAANTSVFLFNNDVGRSATTNVNGNASLSNVPFDQAMTLRATNSQNSALRTEVPFTLTDATSTATVTMPPYGQIGGTATLANGGLILSRCVVSLTGTGYSRSLCTNASGQFSADGVPVGIPITVRVNHPTVSGLFKNTVVTLTEDGQVIAQAFATAAQGTARLTVLQGDGTPFAGVRVETRTTTSPTTFTFRGTTNASGVIDLTGIPEGVFTVRIRNSSATLTLGVRDFEFRAADDGQTVAYTYQLQSFTGTVSGSLRLEDGSPALTPVTVRATAIADGSTVATTFSSTGSYSFANLLQPDGGLQIVASWSRDGEIRSAEQMVTFTTAGQTVTRDFTLPLVIGTVRGRVTASADGAPVQGATVSLTTAAFSSIANNQTTDADGRYAFTDVVMARNRFRVTLAMSGLASGQIVVADRTLDATNTAIVDFVVDGYVVRLTGTVTAADLQTPVSRAPVELQVPCSVNPAFCAGAQTHFTTAFTNATDAGVYEFAQVALPATGARLRVHSPSRYDNVLDVPFTVEATNSTRTVDVVFPITVVTGVVSFSSGVAVRYPSVFATTAEGTTYTTFNDENGRYRLYDVEVGAVTITAQDSESALARAVETTLEAPDQVRTLDIVLPPSTTLAVSAVGPTGAVLEDFCAGVQSAGLAYSRTACASGDGTVTFTNVPLGAVYVQTQYYDSTTFRNVNASVVADLSATPSPFPVTTDYRPTARAALGLTVLGRDGTPVADAYVELRPFGSAGPLGSDNRYLSTDGSGQASVVDLAPGPFRADIQAYDPSTGDYSYAVVSGVLQAGQTTAATARLGTAVAYSFGLIGDDQFVYRIDLFQGAIYAEANPNGVPAVFDYVMEPYINGNYVGDGGLAAADEDRRSLVMGPSFEEGLLFTRRVFSPQAGGFVRIHDEITNALPYERTVTIRVFHNMEDRGTFSLDSATSPTTLTFESSESQTMAVAGFVLGGDGAPVKATRFILPVESDPDDDAEYRYVVKVPAFGTIGLLQFAAQRAPGDFAALLQQLRALADLSDPNALTGLTAAQRAAIRNFVIP